MSKIMNNELATYVVDQLEAGVVSGQIARQLASLLIDERRTRDAYALLRAIEDELNSRGSTQLTITSATELTTEIKDQLAKMLGAKNPVLSEVIDKSIIGGVEAVSGEKQIDLTIRTKLNRFKTAIAKGAN